MNVLVTSAGRRVSLVRAFQNELVKLIPNGKVFTAEVNPEWSSAARVSDGGFVVPYVTDDSYVDVLLSLCRKNSIHLIIPTIDTELEVLSKSRTLFQDNNITIAVSDYSLVELCRDKRLTNGLFELMGIPVPRAVSMDAPVFPVFAKPYDGSLSKGIMLLRQEHEVTEDILNNPKLMFMEYLSPELYQEYTVDAYYDRYGELKCLVPRKRVEVRGGEISKGKTEKNYIYDYLKERLQKIKGARSCLTIQFFASKIDDRIIGIEINPRFGGGYPLSYLSNANYPKWLIEEYLLGKSIAFFEDWIENRVMLRYDEEVIFDDNV